MDKIDFKKMNKELYSPKNEPSVISIPPMNFIMVDGFGNPNDADGEYSKAVELLYALSFTIKMARKKGETDDFPDYTVPPLEGLWWLNDAADMDFTQKEKYCWTSMIRQPDFITKEAFTKAKEELSKKKPGLDVTKAKLETFEEGLCVQCMHNGLFDTEPATIAKIDAYIQNNGMKNAIGTVSQDGRIRRHHEIYLNDPRKVKPEAIKTILRHPAAQQL